MAQQEDVIMDCMDSPDMSIRLRALDLVVGMVSSENLMSIVGRLMRQLRSFTTQIDSQDDVILDTHTVGSIESDDENPEVHIKSQQTGSGTMSTLPDDYRVDVIQRILKMCSSNNYSSLVDFDWYIDVLIQLVRNAPMHPSISVKNSSATSKGFGGIDVTESIGNELRNVAVKVEAIRAAAARAAESIISDGIHGTTSQSAGIRGILRPAAWIVGEYASYLYCPEKVLTGLLQFTKPQSDPEVLAMLLQAVLKVFAHLSRTESVRWGSDRKAMLSLLMARILHILEPLGLHPDLEVQERAMEFTELLRLAAEAFAAIGPSSALNPQDPPLLLTQAMPSLFCGLDLHSIAPGAQHNVPLPTNLNLDQPITSHLNDILREADSEISDRTDEDEDEVYYHQRPATQNYYISDPAVSRLAVSHDDRPQSYQRDREDTYLDPDIVARRRAERLERNKDDPFYIAGISSESAVSTPFDAIIRNDNGNDLDIDSIPIMRLDLGNMPPVTPDPKPRRSAVSNPHQRIRVAADETLVASGSSSPKNEESEASIDGRARSRAMRVKKSLLLVDSSNIEAFVLNGHDGDLTTPIDHERQHREEEEMAKAMQEVEKLRLEMQRANERIQAAQGVPPEGTMVKKKAKKKVKPVVAEDTISEQPRKRKAKKAEEPVGSSKIADLIRPKKGKKKSKEREQGTSTIDDVDVTKDHIPE